MWLDSSARPAPRPPLDGDVETDLVVVGGGFTGLWTALRAKERDPDRRVLLLEADRIADHATGRNGGFCEASLTHGEANGRDRWPDEYELLDRLGRENLAGIAATVERYGIDCDFRTDGVLTVATREHEVAGLSPDEPGFLGADAVRALVDSPTYLAGRMDPDGCALVDPARLAWGLAEAAESLGVRIAERTRVEDVSARRGRVTVRTTSGTVTAARVVLATNAFRPLLARLRFHTVPVYDYVLATEPLTAEQLASIGWQGRHGIADSSNQFHYYRLTADDRILWGGYDAIYHFGRRIDPSLDDRRATHRLLGRAVPRDVPAAGRASGSRTAGAGSSTRARASAPSSGRRSAAGSPTRWASPAWVSEPRGSPPTSCSICSTAPDRADTAADGPPQAAAVPARTLRLRRHPAHPLVVGPGGPHRSPQRLAAHPRPTGPRLRQLIPRPLGDNRVEITILPPQPVPAVAVDAALTRTPPRRIHVMNEPIVSTLRVRIGQEEAHYGGNLVEGARVLKLFGDIVTEVAIITDGDEGLFVGYDKVEFLAPVYAGDFLEVTGTVTRVGNTSRTVQLEARKVIASRYDDTPSGADVLDEPVVVVRAIGTTVVPAKNSRGPGGKGPVP